LPGSGKIQSRLVREVTIRLFDRVQVKLKLKVANSRQRREPTVTGMFLPVLNFSSPFIGQGDRRMGTCQSQLEGVAYSLAEPGRVYCHAD
jgi:hypothetical protein